MNQKTKELAAAVMLAHKVGVKSGVRAAGKGDEAGPEDVQRPLMGLFKIAGLGDQDWQEVEAFLRELAAADAPLPYADEMLFHEMRKESEWPSFLDEERLEYKAVAELFRSARWEMAA